ncbi:hypothetical protein HGRIS_013517 [Hohenbuehelia grisea]|uniref:Uncharacterized protein n=1 Tax=Hohenbuehelia grisea TaxID=104357 RepID=A0ABR3IVM7_9AGAR
MGEMNAAQLHYIEVMCESALYGVYAVLVVVVMYLLIAHRTMPLIHKVMFWAGIVMFVLTTIHLGLVLQQVTVPNTPIKNAQTQVSIATIQFMIGDSILIWRVWAVWNRNWWLTIVPICLMIASAGVRFAIVANFDLVLKFASDVASEIIVANVGLCTFLIAGRIWYLQWQIGKVIKNSPSRKTYIGVLMLLIESGALYFLSQLLGVILDVIHNDGVHTVLDMQIPIIGILPTLIVLLVHLDMVPGTRAQEEYLSTLKSGFHAAPGRSAASGTLGTGRSQVTAVSLASRDADIELGEGKATGTYDGWKPATRSQASIESVNHRV